MSQFISETDLRLVKFEYWWDLDTMAPLHDHYCADSGSKCRHQCDNPGYSGFIFVQWGEVEPRCVVHLYIQSV